MKAGMRLGPKKIIPVGQEVDEHEIDNSEADDDDSISSDRDDTNAYDIHDLQEQVMFRRMPCIAHTLYSLQSKLHTYKKIGLHFSTDNGNWHFVEQVRKSFGCH